MGVESGDWQQWVGDGFVIEGIRLGMGGIEC